jgi:hypothetical protein
MGRARAPLTIAFIEHIFRRQHWRYQLVSGRILTAFGGVPMMLGVDSGQDQVVMVVPLYIVTAGNRGHVRSHKQEVDTFLAAVNYVVGLGTYLRNVEDDDILYRMSLSAEGGALDDETLKEAIAFTVATVKVVGPMVDALVKEQVSLEDALDALRRAVNEVRRRMV